MIRKLIPAVRTVLLPQSRLKINCCSAFSTLRTSETNPVNFDASQLGRFYTMDQEVYKTLFGASDKGIGLPTAFKVQCTTFNEASFLVRKPLLDIKNCIEAYDLSLPVLRYIIYGSQGVGKTTTMANVVHYGYEAGFILAHVPAAHIWGGHLAKETLPSAARPGYYNHTVDSVFWLTFFRHQNAKLLSQLQLKTTKQYDWSQRENTPAGSALTDLIEHGTARPVHSAECIYALLEQLKILSTEQKCKTMVLIDTVNALYYDSPAIKRPDRTNVPYQLLTLFEAFKQMFKSDWTNGVVITTVDKMAYLGLELESDLPRYLLNKDGWEHFDPFIPILVEKYTSQEVQTTIDYYLERKWLQHPLAGTPEARLELEVVSVKNPARLMKLCNSR